VTLLNKLFSSVPKREFAIEDVNLKFGTSRTVVEDDPDNLSLLNFNLLVGRSASGKSTILRIVSGKEKPIKGQVMLNECNIYSLNERNAELSMPKPIMLDSKPDCFDDRSTVMERIVAAAMNTNNKKCNEDSESSTTSSFEKNCFELLAREYATMLNLSDNELSKVPSGLSPSGQYLFGIALACMESTSATAILRRSDDTSERGSEVEVSLPILLLDELLDSETSAIADKVGQGLRNLTQRGGVVLAATHRPEYLSNVADRVITMSGGEVLMIKQL